MRYVARLFVWSVIALIGYGVYLAVKSPEAATFWNTIRGRGADASKPVEQDKANELLHSGKLYQAGKTPGQVR